MGLTSVEGEEQTLVHQDLSSYDSIQTQTRPGSLHLLHSYHTLPLWFLHSEFPDPDNPGNSIKAEAAADLCPSFPVTGRWDALTPQILLFSLTGRDLVFDYSLTVWKKSCHWELLTNFLIARLTVNAWVCKSSGASLTGYLGVLLTVAVPILLA